MGEAEVDLRVHDDAPVRLVDLPVADLRALVARAERLVGAGCPNVPRDVERALARLCRAHAETFARLAGAAETAEQQGQSVVDVVLRLPFRACADAAHARHLLVRVQALEAAAAEARPSEAGALALGMRIALEVHRQLRGGAPHTFATR